MRFSTLFLITLQALVVSLGQQQQQQYAEALLAPSSLAPTTTAMRTARFPTAAASALTQPDKQGLPVEWTTTTAWAAVSSPLLLLLLPLAILTANPPVASAAVGDATTGAVLFSANCAGCHAGGQNFVSSSKTLQQDALEKYLGSTDPVKLQAFVQNGMPHKLFPMRMPMQDQEYLDVATFVSDQALGKKW